MSLNKSFKLNQCEVQPPENIISMGETKLTLQPKFIEVLAFLAQQYPNLVTREQIIDEIWDGNFYVGEKALTNAIWHLRKSLKSFDANVEFIETIRKTGYKLLIEPEYIKPKQDLNKSFNIVWSHTWSLYALGLFALIFIGFISWPDGNQKTQFSKPVLVTQYPGRELYPSVSPDGRYLAFSWRQMNRNIDLYLKDLSQPDLASRNLTHSKFREGRTVWAPDGSALYYYRRSSKIGCQVVKKDLQTSMVELLGNCDSSSSSSVALSKDGLLLAYAGISDKNTDKAIYLKELNSDLPAKRLTCLQNCDYTDESVSFSSDQKYLAISRNTESGHEDIFIHEISSGIERRLTSGYLDIRGLDWHPSENKLIFAAIEHGKRYGFEIDVDSSELVKLPVSGVSFPRYSDEKTIYYHNWQIDTSIMHVELDAQVASSPFPLLQSEFNFRYPNYSISSKQLAMISNESGFDELWISGLDGIKKQQLTQLKQTIKNPVWSHDGKHIAFIVNTVDSNELYVINVQTQNLKRLDTGLVFHNKPSWSGDNQTIYVSDNTNLHQVSVNGEQVKQLTQNGGNYGVETSAGELIYSKGGGKGLWRLPLIAPTQERKLLANIRLPSSTGWQYTDKGIYYFNVKGNDYRLSFYNFETQEHKDIIRVPERSFSRTRGMTYVPENNWLLFTGYESPQVDIKRITAK